MSSFDNEENDLERERFEKIIRDNENNHNEFNISKLANSQVNSLTKGKSLNSLSSVPKEKILEQTFMNMIASEMQKGAEIDEYIDQIEDSLNDPAILQNMDTKILMRWYELMNVRKNHTRKFLMAFFESSSKNDIMGKMFTQMTGKKVDNKELEQDAKTKTAKTILQKLMMDKLADNK